MDQFITDFILGPCRGLVWGTKTPPQRESNFHWTGQNVVIVGTSLTVPHTGIVTRGLAYIPLHEIRVKHSCFPSTAEMCARCYSWEMDRLTLDFVWAWPWARSSDKRTVWITWVGLGSWNFSSFPEFRRDISCQEQFCPAIFRHIRYHCSECWTRDCKEG